MKTFCITYLGCKVNQYESRQIAKTLVCAGLSEVTDAKKADLAIVHTCCVTHAASSKSRQALRQRLTVGNGCIVVATGCLPDAGRQEINGLDDKVIFISKKADLEASLLNIINSSKKTAQKQQTTEPADCPISKTANAYKIKNKNGCSCLKRKKIENNAVFMDKADTFSRQSRAFLKIQDGCDGFCTYCIIPTIRTNVHSRSEDEVIEEARQLITQGNKEIVLTGIFLGAYGQSTVKRRYWDKTKENKFVSLVDKIATIEGLKRLRLSSLEPGDITDKLLDLFKKHEIIAPHLHLSLQSGSSIVLKRMNRQYNADQFKLCIDKVRSVLDRPAITTDIIVGFPGETDNEFQESIEMAEFAQFAKIHVFSFSRRKGTAADRMKEQLPPQVIKERWAELSKIDKKLQKSFRKQFAGEKVSVIIENVKRQSGITGRYFDVQVLNSKLKKGDFLYATLQKDCKTAVICD